MTTATKKTKKNKKNIEVTVNVNLKDSDESSSKKNQKTRIALVVDRSGSMSSVRNSAISGINEQLETIKNHASADQDTELTYIQFNTEIDFRFKKSAKNLSKIEREDYIPDGGTALYDAVWTAINKIDEGSAEKDIAYLVIVVSDGEENSSQMVSGQQLANRIKQLQETGQWTFVYMMSNIDLSAFKNIVHAYNGNSMKYSSTTKGTLRAFGSISNNLVNYLGDRIATNGAYSSTTFFDNDVYTNTDQK